MHSYRIWRLHGGEEGDTPLASEIEGSVRYSLRVRLRYNEVEREKAVQLLRRTCLLHSPRNSGNHLFKLATTARGKALCVCLLQEPKLLKGNNGVTFGDFEVKLKTESIPVL